MKEQKGKETLDELIRRSIDCADPKFDADNWIKQHAQELNTLRSYPIAPTRQRILRRSAPAIAAAAAILVALTLLSLSPRPDQPDKTTIITTAESPADLLTFASLTIAYRRGGIEELERQCKKAFEMTQIAPANFSARDLLTELNGT
jgi:hypothetical protein